MRAFGKWLGRFILLVVVAIAALWFWPRDSSITPPVFDAAMLPDDLDSWLAEREEVFEDLTPGTQKRILWANAPGARTPIAVVYVHGFSATSEETRPVPDMVAASLGANLHFTRLAGHGRDGSAMATASAEDWLTDFAEALAIGARIGDRVVVMGTSTGAAVTLAALGTPELRAAIPAADKVAGVVMISPNFRLHSALESALLDLPGSAWIVPALIGPDRNWTPQSEAHGTYWTTSFPTAALQPMAHVMRAARAVDTASVQVPLLMLYSPDDVVISPEQALAVAARWGGEVQTESYPRQDGMDEEAHVIAGDIRSPGMTARAAARISDWAGGL